MKRNNKSSKKARRRVAGASQDVPKPKQIQLEVKQTRKLRFTNTGANPSTSISWYNLLDTVIVAGTASNGYELYDFVRIKEIEMWGNRGANTASAISIGIDFGGVLAGMQGAGRSWEDTSVSLAQPAYLRVRPDPRSQSAQFQSAQSGIAFHIRASGAPAECVIVDLTLEFINSPLVNPTAVGQAIAAATAGEIYFGGLDALRAVTTAWRSLLLPNVI
jgi:hypothetical protein